MKRKLLLILMAIMAFTSLISATTYYVATNGNNSNSGTISNPWLTIQHAADNVVSGDIIYIREGTYNGCTITNSGSSGNPITFCNYSGENSIVDGNNYTLGGIDIRASYITIDGIQFNNINGDGIHIEGSISGTANPITDIIIRNCQIDGTSNAGIYCAGLIMGQTIPVDEYRVFNVLIEKNDITNTNYPSGTNECISIGGGTNGFIIRNNYVHDSEQYGIDAKFGAINGKIYGNVVHNIEKHGIYIDTNSRTCENIDIYNNFISNCGANGLTLARESRREPKVPNMRNIRIFDNVFTGCLRGVLAYKLNSDVDPGTGDYKDIVIVNNTCHDNNAGSDPQSIKIYNISDVNDHSGWIIANNLTSENNPPLFVNSTGGDWIVTNNVNIATDAPYVDADNLDFHLVDGSVAEDAASSTYLQKNTDFDGANRGTPPDAGAFQSMILSDNFEDGNDNGWTQETGSWGVVTDNGSKRYEQGTYSTSEYRTSIGETTWDNYSFQVDVQPLSFDGNSAIFINFRYTNNSNTYRVVVHGYNQLRLQKKVNGVLTELTSLSYTFNTGSIYTIRIDAEDTNLKVYINDTLKINLTDSSLDSGKISLTTWKTTANFDNVFVQKITNGMSKIIATSQESIKQVNDYSIVCYPNPFKASTRVRFNIPSTMEESKVVLTVNDLFGREVTMLVNDNLDSGEHEVEFNASGLPNGMYIFRLQRGNSFVTYSVVLIK